MTRRPFFAARLTLLCVPIVLSGCGDQLVSEIGGVIVEYVTFQSEFARTGEPVCQGPPVRCGPPIFFALLVPDCPFEVVCFGDACNTHDRCYGTCGSSQSACDNQFLEDLLASCAGAFFEGDSEFSSCAGLAFIYWQTVVQVGHLAHEISQELVCGCLGIARTKAAQVEAAPSPLSGFRPFEDKDGDLMPDEWECEIGLDCTDPADAREDPDEDGFLNLEEFIRGSDPFDAGSNSFGLEDD